MTRVAAIDLGTNSTRLLVADVADGNLDEVVRRLTITRLGEGVDERRRLLPVPIARVRSCLTEYRRELEELGATRTLAIATSAVRDAENGEAFLGEIEWSYGFTTRLLDGTEEAALMLRGVSTGRDSLAGTLVVDIGGGSTELVLSENGAGPSAVSLDVGCVRLTERYLRSDPPTTPELAAASAYVGSLLPRLEPRAAIGVAGTVTTLASVHLALPSYDRRAVDGLHVPIEAMQKISGMIAGMDYEGRSSLPCIGTERADLVVAGCAILEAIIEIWPAKNLGVADRGIREGILRSLMARDGWKL